MQNSLNFRFNYCYLPFRIHDEPLLAIESVIFNRPQEREDYGYSSMFRANCLCEYRDTRLRAARETGAVLFDFIGKRRELLLLSPFGLDSCSGKEKKKKKKKIKESEIKRREKKIEQRTEYSR